MSFDATAERVLDSCARAIVSRQKGVFDLLMFNSAFNAGREDEIVAALAERVEDFSGGSKTIRRADGALFGVTIMGPNLYLVLCARNTPKGEVTKLDNDMVLVNFGPYGNGLEIDVRRAP